jgi:hemoglobin-like flavoprotein
MASSHADTFVASLDRCLTKPEFLHTFYDMFVGSSQEIREKFNETDFPKQVRVLADSLYLMAVASESQDHAIAWRELDRLAKKHSRTGLGIRPELYDIWLERLIEAARQYDPSFSTDIEHAWRAALTPGIEP